METKQAKMPQAHGLSQQEMADLKIQQQQGQEEFKTANKNNEYEIPANEGHLVHVSIEAKTFNQQTGEKISKPFIQSFYPNEFDTMVADGNFKGYSVEVLHDPRTKAKITEDLVNAAISTPLANALVEKPLEEMTDQELSLKYASLYKEDAKPNASRKEMIEAVTEKLEFIRGEEAVLNLDHASEDAGTGKGPAVEQQSTSNPATVQGNTPTTKGNSQAAGKGGDTKGK